MRKISLAMLIALIAAPSAADSQIILSRGFMSRSTGPSNSTAMVEELPSRASMWTTTLPVTFSRLQRVEGKWRLGSDMSIGSAFVWLTGKVRTEQGGSGRLEAQFMIGPVANIGFSPTDDGHLDGALMVGATMGFANLALLGGYDVLLERWVIGVGTQIQSLSMTEKLTTKASFR